MRLIFIGGGNMAQAIFKKLDYTKYSIIVIQRNPSKLAQLIAQYPAIKCFADVSEIQIVTTDILFLTVKPQDAQIVCAQIRNLSIQDNLIVSLMAGISCDSLTKWLHNKHLIRVMSNIAAEVSQAINAIYFSTPNLQQDNILKIFAAIGTNYVFTTEEIIDKMTIIGGSGPIYILLLIEILTNVFTKEFEFEALQSHNLVINLLKGCLAVIENNPTINVAQLMAKIVSKKGTTQAILDSLRQNNFADIINNSVLAGYNRAKELATTYKN
jgi:pyrroline-5-carboxylate reductase